MHWLALRTGPIHKSLRILETVQGTSRFPMIFAFLFVVSPLPFEQKTANTMTIRDSLMPR
jgi:hypothetical protein